MFTLLIVGRLRSGKSFIFNNLIGKVVSKSTLSYYKDSDASYDSTDTIGEPTGYKGSDVCTTEEIIQYVDEKNGITYVDTPPIGHVFYEHNYKVIREYIKSIKGHFKILYVFKSCRGYINNLQGISYIRFINTMNLNFCQCGVIINGVRKFIDNEKFFYKLTKSVKPWLNTFTYRDMANEFLKAIKCREHMGQMCKEDRVKIVNMFIVHWIDDEWQDGDEGDGGKNLWIEKVEMSYFKKFLNRLVMLIKK